MAQATLAPPIAQREPGPPSGAATPYHAECNNPARASDPRAPGRRRDPRRQPADARGGAAGSTAPAPREGAQVHRPGATPGGGRIPQLHLRHHPRGGGPGSGGAGRRRAPRQRGARRDEARRARRRRTRHRRGGLGGDDRRGGARRDPRGADRRRRGIAALWLSPRRRRPAGVVRALARSPGARGHGLRGARHARARARGARRRHGEGHAPAPRRARGGGRRRGLRAAERARGT